MRPILPLSLLGLAACAPETGIWLLEVNTSGETSCESTLTHNYVNVVEPMEDSEDDPNWTEESNASESPQLQFVQIEMGAGTNCIMLSGSNVYPGTCDGSSWTFEWALEDIGDTSQEHALGYLYSHNYEYTASTKLKLEISGESGSGTMTEEVFRQDIYSESDMWAQSVGVPAGRMPVGDYLKKMGQDPDGNPILQEVANTRANTECAASECSLEATETCSSAASTVRANHYTFSENTNYNNVRDNGQSSGVPPAQPNGQAPNNGGN